MVNDLLLLGHLIEVRLLRGRGWWLLHQGHFEVLENPRDELPGGERLSIFNLVELILAQAEHARTFSYDIVHGLFRHLNDLC